MWIAKECAKELSLEKKAFFKHAEKAQENI
jgi:hypothetical protein